MALISGKTSLLTRQKEMAITGNNIARAGQAGYHRQSATVQSNIMVHGEGGFYGTGVHVDNVVRKYDAALEASLRQSTGQSSYHNTYTRQVGNMESLLGPGGDNQLSEAIQDFANALQQAGTSPESIPNRTSLLSASNAVADKFNQQYEALRKVRDNISDYTAGTGAISNKVNELNNLISQIPALNETIRTYEENAYRGQTANDMRDDRDIIVSQIAKLADIHVTEESDFRYTIRIGGPTGNILVDSTDPAIKSNNETLQINVGAGGVPEIQWATDNAAGHDAKGVGSAVNLTTGEIQGYVKAREFCVQEMNNLHTYAAQFNQRIDNAVHTNGLDLDGNSPGVSDWFTASGTPPASGDILTHHMTDPRDLALNGSGDAANIGDGSNAVAMWQALDATNATLNNDTLLSHSDRLLGGIAEEVQLSATKAETADATQTMFQNAVFEISAVNTDEEMIEMLEIQRAYQASAKYMSTVNNMLMSVLQLI